MATKKKKQKDKSFLRVLVIIIKIEPLTTHLIQSPTYYTTSVAMSSENDDNLPCGVQPHAQASWRAKYEYMDRLWIQQGKEIAELKAKLSKKDTELQVEATKKKNMEAEVLQLQAAAETEKAKAAAEIAELRVQLAKKDTQLEAEVLNINKETEAHRLKLEEAKKTNATKWASCFGCP